MRAVIMASIQIPNQNRLTTIFVTIRKRHAIRAMQREMFLVALEHTVKIASCWFHRVINSNSSWNHLGIVRGIMVVDYVIMMRFMTSPTVDGHRWWIIITIIIEEIWQILCSNFVINRHHIVAVAIETVSRKWIKTRIIWSLVRPPRPTVRRIVHHQILTIA